MLRKCAWAALAVVLAACKNSTPQPPAALPGTCSGDAECAANFRCDHEMRRCVCTSDAACATGKFCNAFTGLCVSSVAGCSTVAGAGSVQCGAGQYCNTALRTCKAITPFCQPCKSDAECGSGSACAAHPDFPNAGTFCLGACDASGACASGLACRKASSGQSLCYPAGACGQSNACVPDSLKLCSADADCGDANQACDQTLKACIARNRTCPAGDACDPQSSICVHACASDADCGLIEGAPGYQCRANGCFRLQLCSQDSECTSGQICQRNPDGSKSCRAGCVSNADCPLGSGCNATDPNHPRCAPGCTQNSDCALNAICSNRVCVSSTTAPLCTQVCQATPVCSIGATCNNNCCLQADLPTTCGHAGCPSCTAAGCAISCSNNCFPMNLAPCSTVSQCYAKFPSLRTSVVCNANAGQCQILGHLLPCTSSSDCPMKGFQCIPASQLGCGGGGSLCFPSETAAQIACGVGHP
jgi:hypothetical protein